MKNVIEPVTTPPSSDELKLRLDTIRAMMMAEELDYYRHEKSPFPGPTGTAYRHHLQRRHKGDDGDNAF